ncbi:hypothetical protein ACIP9C_15800 [Lysinibacillus sp. NPDC093210]|jgi:hypothetical protein|uniref:hypothetical protein n=1 Tax=Lysinibacillus sp. NPDC093210 TaxID=3364133 RepID=UPI0038045B02
MGKPVDYNLFPAYQDSLDSRLIERKEEYIEELEKVKNEGVVLRFEKATELPP